MRDENLVDDATDPAPEKVKHPNFWRSGFRISLIISLSIAAVFLGFEYKDYIFSGGGFFVLLLLGCVLMHLFMHGGHGGHGGGDKS